MSLVNLTCYLWQHWWTVLTVIGFLFHKNWVSYAQILQQERLLFSLWSVTILFFKFLPLSQLCQMWPLHIPPNSSKQHLVTGKIKQRYFTSLSFPCDLLEMCSSMQVSWIFIRLTCCITKLVSKNTFLPCSCIHLKMWYYDKFRLQFSI